MSRTRRVVAATDFWATVDDWAADRVDRSRLRAWFATGPRLDAESGPYLDVVDPPPGARLPGRPLRGAVAARGTALPATDAVADALAEQGVAAARVERARRYRWAGPAFAPVLVELRTSGDEGVVEAWWEDVWMAWPELRSGEDRGGRPSRRRRAVTQVDALLTALGADPLPRAT